MRSYRQHCGLAKALDLVGDRWTLLIVRDLLAGPARYSDLLHSLPGIATNLLTERLREMERAGLIALYPVAGTGRARAPVQFTLTDRGRALEPVIAAFGVWSAPFMGEPGRRDRLRARWLTVPAYLYLRDVRPSGPAVRVALRCTGDDSLLVETTGTERVRARVGDASDADLALTGPTRVVFRALMGRSSLADAKRQGLAVDGDERILARLRSQPAVRRPG